MISHQPSLTEKIGQMLLLGFDGQTLNESSSILRDISQFNIGGVILFDRCLKTKTQKNIVSSQQVQALTQTLREQVAENSLPLLISVDYEGGKVNRLKEEYGFVPTYTAVELVEGGPEFALQQARVMARVLATHGFNLDFAPVVDVNIVPNNPIIGMLARSFSEDGGVVSEYAQLFLQAFHEAGILSCYKHFPGHGSSLADSHLGFVDVTSTWDDSELVPYRSFSQLKSPVDMIMTAHIINRQLDPSGLPATLSKPILTDLLRHQLNYEGVVITDDMQMKAISAEFSEEEAMVMAVNAGADMVIYGNQLSDANACAEGLVERIYKNVLNGQIQESRIHEAYERIKNMKARITV